MAMKLLLVAFSTNREVDDQTRRVRFAAKSVVDLTDEEIELLDKLTKSTGKLHYRDPISEGGKVAESAPEVVHVPDYAGQDTPMAEKSVDQLKAYLTFHGVDFESGAKKADLLALAQSAGNDPDSGL